MSIVEQRQVMIEPIINYPREAQAGKSYIMTIDLQITASYKDWPFDEEEYPIWFILNTDPLFSYEPFDSKDTAVVLHRFGGTYGPATFLLTSASQEMKGTFSIMLINDWGIPIEEIKVESTIIAATSLVHHVSPLPATAMPRPSAESVEVGAPLDSEQISANPLLPSIPASDTSQPTSLPRTSSAESHYPIKSSNTVSKKCRFGVVILPNVDWPWLVQRWQQLEALGFDSIWNMDNPYVIKQYPFDSQTLLNALATQTKTVRIGTLFSSATCSNPYLLAKESLTLDHISQGRVELGICAGRQQPDYLMAGVPFIADLVGRVQRFREVVEIVDKLLDNRHILESKNGLGITYEGTYFKIKNAINTLEPYKTHIPITLAAHGRSSLALVARYADTWISYGGRDLSPEQTYKITQSRIKKLQQYCKQYQRDFHQIRKAFLVGFTKDEPFASEDAFRNFVGAYSELGITDFIFYYPANEFYNTPKLDKKDLFEHIARNVFPEFQ